MDENETNIPLLMDLLDQAQKIQREHELEISFLKSKVERLEKMQCCDRDELGRRFIKIQDLLSTIDGLYKRYGRPPMAPMGKL
jgi:hypothetical protein